jgi:hypothetical protein
MTAKDQKAREQFQYREGVYECARLFQNAMKLQNLVPTVYDPKQWTDAGAKQWADAAEQWTDAGERLWVLCDFNSKNLSKAFHDLGLVLDGKLPNKNKKFDALYINAWWIEIRKCPKGHPIHLGPPSSGWYETVKKECKREGISRAPTRFAAMRRLKQLGFPLQKRK